MEGQVMKTMKQKSFWKRPEGVTGGIFVGGIVIGVGYLLYKFLPFLISILQNAIHAAILFAVLGAILYILLDPKFRNLLWFFYKSAMRWITSLFVQIDPIGILETYVQYLYKNLREMDDHISKLKGQIHKIKTLIQKNAKEMTENLQIAEQAKKKGNKELVAINTRQYGRLEETNKRYNELMQKMEVLYRVLSKIHKNSGYLIQDIENEVRMRKQERVAIKAGYSAMRRAMNIINGDPDKKMLFDQAMEVIVEDVSNKIGEMERFMELSASFIESIDLQNGVYEQKGLELLEKIEQDGTSFLVTDERYIIPNDAKEVLEIEIAEEKDDIKEQTNNYTDLF